MLQKNVLDYLDSSAARFPHKLAFADEARSFTFGQLRACAGAWAPRWPIWVPSTTGRGGAGQPHRGQPGRLLWGVGSRTFLCPPGPSNASAPGCGGFWRPSPCRAGLPRRGGDPGPGPGGPVPGAVCGGGICPSPQDALLDARRGRVLDIDPVYAIFTSGSTGTPKGIVIAHRSVIDFTEWMADACQFTHQDVMGNQPPSTLTCL